MDKSIGRKAEKFVDSTLKDIQKITKITITNNDEYLQANDWLRQAKAKYKKLLEIRLSITCHIDEAKKSAIDYFRPAVEGSIEFIKMINDGMIQWQQVQKEKNRADEIRLQKIAYKEEEKKRQALIKRAERAEKNGKIYKIEELMEKAKEVHIYAPIVLPTIPKIKGTYTRRDWKYRIVDISKVDRKWLMINDKKLSDFAREKKGQVLVKGIAFYFTESIGNRKVT